VTRMAGLTGAGEKKLNLISDSVAGLTGLAGDRAGHCRVMGGVA
jgi:hypothetical protein